MNIPFHKSIFNFAEKWISFILGICLDRKHKSSLPPQSNRILIIKLCCFGDAILSLYAIRAYKENHPNCLIDVLASTRVAIVYQNVEWINNVYTLPINGRNKWKEIHRIKSIVSLIQILNALKSNQYSHLFDFENHFFFPYFFQRFLSIPISLGFIVPQKKDLIEKRDIEKQKKYSNRGYHDVNIYRSPNLHESQCFIDLMQTKANNKTFAPLFKPVQNNQFKSKEKKTIGLVIGHSPNWPQKSWPFEYFVSLIKKITARNMQIIFYVTETESLKAKVMIDTANEELQAQSLINESIHIHVLGNDWDFNLQKMGQCDLLIGNDTGAMHLADAMGIFTLPLFGPTNQQKWGPIRGKAIFHRNLPCRPCYYLSDMPNCSHFSCLREIKPAQIMEEIDSFLNEQSKNYFFSLN